MKGFEIFNQYNTDKILRKQLLADERAVLRELCQIISAGANLDRILDYKKDFDLALISIFRTGENPNTDGIKYYQEVEKNFNRNIKQNSKKIGLRKKKRRTVSLAQDIRNAGFSLIQIKGNYEVAEDSFVVVNPIEDTDVFAARLLALARNYQQEVVLIVPKQNIPYLLYFDGRKEYTKDASITELKNSIIKYFSQSSGREFAFESLQAEPAIVDGRAGLSPIRHGMECMIPLGCRKSLDKTYPDLQRIIISCIGKVYVG